MLFQTHTLFSINESEIGTGAVRLQNDLKKKKKTPPHNSDPNDLSRLKYLFYYSYSPFPVNVGYKI